MSALVAHEEDLFGSEGAKATSRAELLLDLKLNKDAWKVLSGQEQYDWVTNRMINGSQQRRLSNPRIILWNVGPHGYRNSREKSGPYLPRDSRSSVYRIYGSHGS